MDTKKQNLIEAASLVTSVFGITGTDKAQKDAMTKLHQALNDAEEARTAEETFLFDLAKEVWHRDGEVEIDDDAVVSVSEEGAYVQAWVWVEK